MSVLVLTLCDGESTHGPILSREEVALSNQQPAAETTMFLNTI